MNKIYVENFSFAPKNFTGVVETYNKDLCWLKEGKLYQRENDQPSIQYCDGRKKWFMDEKLHRTTGPAVEKPICKFSGVTIFMDYKEWWVEGKQYFPLVFEFYGHNFFSEDRILLKKEKDKYGLEWLWFLTENEIKKYPLIPGIESDGRTKPYYDCLAIHL